MKINVSQSGFSLVETLVAITILLLVIIGPMTISSQAAKSSSFASEQVTAFFLAQEGIELIEKARDDLVLRQFLPSGNPNYLASPWNTFTNTSGTYAQCYTASGCGIHISNDSAGSLSSPVSCSTITNCALRLLSQGSNRARFQHTASGASAATPFTRVIQLQNIPGGDEVQVTSKVTWRTGSLRNQQEVLVETRLFNVYGN